MDLETDQWIKHFKPLPDLTMTITETKKEQGLLNFFGDAEVVKQFQKLTKPEQMIQFMWKVPHFQVRHNILIMLIIYKYIIY